MKTRYNITLSESDLLIIAWKRKIMEAKPSEMSALIKDAILTFIETGTFIMILLVSLSYSIISLIAQWKLFKKAGKNYQAPP
mgnify:CR=1 FL=1